MWISFMILGLATLLSNSAVMAKTFEVQMLNKGKTGKMVFEPAYLSMAVGDTVNFIPSSKGHNAETIKGMILKGAKKFNSKINKEFSVTLEAEGLYGIKCTPHYAMGMVALRQVESAVNFDETNAIKHRARQRAGLQICLNRFVSRKFT